MPSTDSSANQPHPTCVETTTHVELAMGVRSYVCGPDCPRPGAPAPARDARRRVRAERERRRAARALDGYMEIMFGPDHPITDTHEVWRVAGERFVEAVGDYVLSELHHNGDYGVAPEFAPDRYVTTVTRPCECDRPDRDGPHPRMGSCAAREMGVPSEVIGVARAEIIHGDTSNAPPRCSAHGQPMVAGLVGADGEVDWKCVCVLGGGS